MRRHASPPEALRPARRALLLAAAGALAGCASAPEPPAEPVSLAVTIVADPDVNPDARGRAAPIAVRLLELASPTSFESADYFSLDERAEAVLGADLLARDALVMTPGSTRTIARKANPRTRYLGVVAGYRELDRSVWRASGTIAAPARGARTQAVTVRLARSGLTLAIAPAG